MTRQTGILGLRGTVAGLTFRKDGSVSQKVPSNKTAFKGAESLARTRENAAEFGTAAQAGKLTRTALRAAVAAVADARMVGRMTQLMRYILGLDTTNPRGSRLVLKANIGPLQGFDFNAGASFGSVFFAPYNVTALTAGALAVEVPSITPSSDLAAPTGATHYELVAAAAKLNFKSGEVTIGELIDVPGIQPLDANAATNQNTTIGGLGALAGEDVLVVALGVKFYQEVNGKYYLLNNGASSALAVVSAN